MADTSESEVPGERSKQGTPFGVRSGINGSVPDPLEPAPAPPPDNGAREHSNTVPKDRMPPHSR